MNEQPEKIPVDTRVLNAVLQYLNTKPFNEVNGLIQSIMAEVPRPAPEPVVEDKPKK